MRVRRWLLAAPAGLCLFSPSASPAQQYQYAPTPDYYRNDTAQGTVVGGGLGAVAGALIGNGRGKSTEGALIGAAAGALTGNLFGRSKDANDQRLAQNGFANAANASAQAAALAVTNYDLAEMSRAGLDDGVIVGAIQSRGGRFDLSPNGLIQLKQAGVSDRVVMAAQSASPGPVPMMAQRPVTIVEPAPVFVRPAPVYYYEPAPTVFFHFGGGHHHHHCW
ncbi:MAG: glycine zipper domain-containing protein [Lacipirellulaceae bacterium]